MIRHELSWSASRSATFDVCRRRYYLHYYGSWRGWERNASGDQRRAWLLKKMTRMPMLAGDLVHQAIARWFEGRRLGVRGTRDEAIAWATAELRAKYKESRDGKWKLRPARLCHLAEHHYREARIDEASGAAGEYGKRFVTRIRDCLTTFFDHPDLEDVRAAAPGDYLAFEEMQTFELFGTKVYAVPDFALRRPAGALLYDWKTGAPREEDRFQLAVYALFARDAWGIDPAEVTCRDVYLERGEQREVCLDPAEREAVLERIQTSLQAMGAVHFDADVNPGDPEGFPLRVEDEDGGRECGTCNYRELCGRE